MDIKEKTGFTEDVSSPTYLKTETVQESDGTITPTYDISTSSAGFDAAATKKLLRKMDWHIVPFLALLYL